jgi:hypothetical protein
VGSELTVPSWVTCRGDGLSTLLVLGRNTHALKFLPFKRYIAIKSTIALGSRKPKYRVSSGLINRAPLAVWCPGAISPART